MNYDKIFNIINEYCEKTNDFEKVLTFSFDFVEDNSARFSVYDTNYMEDEDDIKKDVLDMFNECGVDAKAEWDYDCGDMYDHWCDLKITF